MNRSRLESQNQEKRANTPHMRQMIAAFCRTALNDYHLAGRPFGDGMEGWLIWFEFGQRTTSN
ncbi:MAG: hypothetical protein KatS3mg044_0375 [Rhodothermaceae bacterium]|nr:MAG: hypothetical protein KatS3mg044_0375 [Rhodothermaceae bacterium]